MPYTVTATPYGYRTAVGAPFTPAEAETWFAEVKRAIGAPHPFGQVIDVREQRAQEPRTQEIVEEAQTWVREQGMQRSAVVVASAIVKMQIQRLSRETGMYAYERYLDASSDPDWETKAVAWVKDGVDPDA